VPEEIFFLLDFMVQWKITEADTPTIWLGATNQRPTSIIPHFYAGRPSCRWPPALSWFGTGTIYAGLHSQWRGRDQQWDSNDWSRVYCAAR